MTEAEYLRTEALRCRAWAEKRARTPEAADLLDLAVGYEGQAARLEARSFAPTPGVLATRGVH